MTRTLHPRAIVAAAATAALAAGSALAQPAGVSGTMTINGAPVSLRHAVAQAYTRPPGGAVAVYAVALTDRPLPAGALNGPEGAGARLLAYQKKVRGLLLLIDAADTTGATAVVLDAFGTKGLKASIIKFGTPDWQDLTELKIAAGRISARAVREWPIDAVRHRLAFDVALTPEPVITSDVKGKDAVRASAPWQAANEQLGRMANVNVKTAKALALGVGPVSRAQNDVGLEHLFDEAVLADLSKKRAAELRPVLDSATRVVERGRWATLVPADPKAAAIEMVADDKGGWLFGQ